MLVVSDSKRVTYIDSYEELERVLLNRYENDANEFWIYDEGVEYPALAIVARGQVACVHFFQNDEDGGFISAGDELAEGDSLFFANGGEEQQISNKMIVPFSKVLDASKEFFASRDFPKAITWMAIGE